MAWLQHIHLIMNLAACAISIQHALQRFAPSAATAVEEPRSGTRFLWPSMRSEHYLNKFGFGLKSHLLDPSQIEPPILSLYLVVPSFFYLLLSFVLFFLSSGPHSNQPHWTGHPRLNIIQNKINIINQQLQLLIFPKFMQT